MNTCPLCNCKIKSVARVHYRNSEWVTVDNKPYVNLFSFAWHVLDEHLVKNRSSQKLECFCGSPIHSVENFMDHLLKVGNRKERLEHLRFHALGRKT